MINKISIVFVFLLSGLSVNAQTNNLPLWESSKEKLPSTDWILNATNYTAQVYETANKKELVLSNGLLKRVFRIAPTIACVDYKNLVNGQQLLRAITPEARVNINGVSYDIGGLVGQKEKAYLLADWINKFQSALSAFAFSSYKVQALSPYLKWQPKTWASNTKQPNGKLISFIYTGTSIALKGITVTVNYELYDGIPLIVKWVSINNASTKSVKINRVTSEILAAVEEESAVVGASDKVPLTNGIYESNQVLEPASGMKVPEGIYLETNYAFNNAMRYPLSDQTTHWLVDTTYTSQVNYNFRTPCLLEVFPEKALGIELPVGQKMNSVRTHELLMDSYDRERRGLAIKKMYRCIAPWTTANPIFMHLVSRNDEQVRTAIDQCVATGYEALILSFGSHIDMEDTSAVNIARWKKNTAYAHSKGIAIGGYSLFSSRRISDEDDVVSAKTGKPGGAFFGNAPCFGSNWGLNYRDKIKYFFAQTGFDIWENDGPFPGDVCASKVHPGHTGLDDSQWKQMEIQKELYHWLNERGVYINAPDWYFLDGTNKIGIGYREVNFSLPRENQMILNRQNIFDGTWNMIPSMGWGFVPLTKYQGGGKEAILEPLNEHLKDYEQLMMQYYGSGVQACYRGPRLYDTESTKQMVTKVISWYKQYRFILNSDIIHLRRADGRDYDGILHVNPTLKTKGLVMLYNPLKESITRSIKLPLYYTGLTNKVTIAERGLHSVVKSLNRNYEVLLNFTIAPESYTWFTIE